MQLRINLRNAFVREVILYDDEIVITYNFTDSTEHLKLTKEHVIKIEKEIETADKTAVSSNTGSYKLCHTAHVESIGLVPRKSLHNGFKPFLLFLRSFLYIDKTIKGTAGFL